MKKSMHRTVTVMAAGVVTAFALSASADPLIDNALLNGDFESWTYAGGVPTRLEPPDGWLNVDGVASTDYNDPASAPISGAYSLITEGNGATRGQLTLQEPLTVGALWRFRADFAVEDPFVSGTQDETATAFSIQHPDSGSGNGGRIQMWIRDNNVDDGVAELWLRNVDAGNAAQLQGTIGGVGFFSADIINAPVVHELIIDGHYDDPSPYYDLTINLNGGGSASFPGLQIWQSGKPVQGDSPNSLRIFGDSFSTGRGKWDNVEFGSLIPEPSSMVLIWLGLLTLRAFRRRG